MKIRNISKKVIGIAGNVVMPDNEITVGELEGKTPAVDALVKQGYLVILDEPKETEKTEKTEKKPRGKRGAKVEEVTEETEAVAETEE